MTGRPRLLASSCVLTTCMACSSLWNPWRTYRDQPCDPQASLCSEDLVCNPTSNKCEPPPGSDADMGGIPTGALAWRVVSSGTAARLQGVWSSDANNAWAVGDVAVTQGPVIVKWNGSEWSPEATPPTTRMLALNAVWGSDTSNVWAVGASATILKRNTTSTAWEEVSTGPQRFRGIWGTSAADVRVVGDNGMSIVRWNGSSWQQENDISNNGLEAIWGDSTRNYWAVGLNGSIRRWDGSTWRMANSGPNLNMYGIWGASSDDLWAVGQI